MRVLAWAMVSRPAFEVMLRCASIKETDDMRTTINLDDDVLAAVKRLAGAQSKSLGETVSNLLRQGLEHRLTIRHEHGIPTFDVPPGAKPFSLEDIRREDAEW